LTEDDEMSKTERQQNRFILGVLVGGIGAYLVTNGNIQLTIVVALVAGIAAAVLLK
jgi:phage shock protein PspC (stress-responsive transcriptional regulator)